MSKNSKILKKNQLEVQFKIDIDSPLETFMDDNHKYSIKEYRDALYTHIAQKKKAEHKSLIIRNLNHGNVNLSAEKSNSPTKKDSFIYTKKDSEADSQN